MPHFPAHALLHTCAECERKTFYDTKASFYFSGSCATLWPDLLITFKEEPHEIAGTRSSGEICPPTAKSGGTSTMIAATLENETARLRALESLEILDTEREPEFDELVGLASAICEVPMSLVSLIDADRQWFKAQIGLEARETPRTVAFCNHAIQQTEMLVVEDAQNDSRFSSNPLVTDGLRIRFYAGMPVTSPDGHAVGTLCVIDSKPRKLTKGQMTALRILGSQVNARMELRVQRKKLQRACKEAEEARSQLHAIEERFRLFMDNSPILSLIKDEDGRIVFYNQMLAERFNIDRKEWLGKTSFDLWPEKEAKLIQERDNQVLAGETQQALEQTSTEDGGEVSHWKSYRFPLVASDGVRMIGTASIEVTEELRREAALQDSQRQLQIANVCLRSLVRTDALTGLHNRRSFDERLNAEFARSSRKGNDLSVLLIDVDNFKQRNDKYGHPNGDETLRLLANVLQNTIRLGDLAARYGGEEFVVLLPETNEEQAMRLAERLLEAVRKTTWTFAPVTVSIGVAALHPSTRSEQRLVALADEALYAAKRAGKDRFVVYGEYYDAMLKDLGGASPS